MANIYQDIEDAVKAKLAADTWFKNTANVKTIQVDLPETPAPVVEYQDLFPAHDLPAVAVIANLDETRVSADTIGERTLEVPVRALGVVMNARKASARNLAQALCWELERVLSSCRDSSHSLSLTGKGNFVKSVSSQIEVRQGTSKRKYFGLVEVTATVVAVRDL